MNEITYMDSKLNKTNAKITTENSKYDINAFCCEFCLVNDILETLLDQKDIHKRPFVAVTAICDYETTANLLKIVPNINIFDDIDIIPSFIDFDNTEDEFAVTISVDGEGVFEYYIEPAYSLDENFDKKYYYFESDVVYIQDTVNSKAEIENAKYDNKPIVCFSLDEEFTSHMK